jgi:hypothetical protein
MLLSAGLVAYAIYSTAVPAYDLIPSKNGRYAFAALVHPVGRRRWLSNAAQEHGAHRLRAGCADRSEQVRKGAAPEGKTGPFDVTVSGTLKPKARRTAMLSLTCKSLAKAAVRHSAVSFRSVPTRCGFAGHVELGPSRATRSSTVCPAVSVATP